MKKSEVKEKLVIPKINQLLERAKRRRFMNHVLIKVPQEKIKEDFYSYFEDIGRFYDGYIEALYEVHKIERRPEYWDLFQECVDAFDFDN